MAKKNPYTVLRVLPTASHADIRRAYLSRLEIIRPERFDPKTQTEDWKKATEMVREINEAYEELKEDAAPASGGSPRHTGLGAKTSRTTWVVFIALAVVVVLAVSSRSSRVSSGRPSLPSVPPPNGGVTASLPGLVGSTFNVPPKELPPNGFFARYQNQPAVAPLTITVAPGAHYLVKIEDAGTGVPVLSVFIHSGQTVQTKAPLGNFRLKYAMGSTWYGEQFLFGPETNYHKAERTLGFSQTATGYSGHIIQLIKQVSGNLPTTQIGPRDW
jgi:curved DNA-binding protein CbpA